MNNLIILFIVAIIFATWIFKKTKGEIMSCSFVTVSFMGISSALLYYQSLVWKIELGNNALWLLIFGMLSLCLGEFCAQTKYRRTPLSPVIKYEKYTIRYCNLLILIYVSATILYAMEIRRLGSMIGYNDLSAIGEVKANIDELNSNMNPIVRQMYKVVTAACYIHALIFANNVFLIKSSWIREFKHLIPFICTIFVSLASGGRLNIYKAMIGLLFIGYMILRESAQWKIIYLNKVVKVGLLLMCGFIVLFSAVGVFVKANASSRAEIETVKYISYYAGGPIQVFNIRVEDGRERWAYERFGNYTFSGIYQILNTGKDAKSERIGNGLIYLGGLSDISGNAHTIFGGTYLDFGAFGMALFLFISYYLFAKYYYKLVLYTYSSYKRNRNLLVYTYCYVSIIALAFYDSCFWILLSTTGILTLVVLLMLNWVYFKKLLISNQ